MRKTTAWRWSEAEPPVTGYDNGILTRRWRQIMGEGVNPRMQTMGIRLHVSRSHGVHTQCNQSVATVGASARSGRVLQTPSGRQFIGSIQENRGNFSLISSNFPFLINLFSLSLSPNKNNIDEKRMEYNRLGDYIREVNVRNRVEKVSKPRLTDRVRYLDERTESLI